MPVPATPRSLEIWPGVVSAIRPYDAGLLMAVDPLHKVLRKETAYDLLLKAFMQLPQAQRKMTDDGRPIFPQEARQKVCAELVGCTIMLTCPGPHSDRYSNKMNRVDDFDFDKTPASTFLRSDGSQMRIVDYLATNYPDTVDPATCDMGQPLIVRDCGQG